MRYMGKSETRRETRFLQIKGIMWMKSLIPRTGPLASLQDKALASNV